MFFILMWSCFVASAQKQLDPIKLNQVGYYPNSSKLAIVTGNAGPGDFYVVSEDGSDTLYKGFLSDKKKSAFSSTTTRIADFSSFRIPGTYILRISDLKQSFPFEIKNEVFSELSKALLKGFYYQRSSLALDGKYAGKWNRAAEYADDAVYIHPSANTDNRPSGTIISARGGWYDAGDCNKSIVGNGITMSTLLSAYEDFSNHFDTLSTNIPESNDKVPDILNEVLYNLRWMFTMQDPFDGGVYHKCTSAGFKDGIMTAGNRESRYVVQKSTAATLDFAAVMAQAGRIFRRMKAQLPGLADSCLRASANAWFWALKYPDVFYDQDILDKKYKPSVTTCAYSDDQLDDEWMWAATEMFVTSKNKMYFDVIEQNMNDSASLPSWNNVRMLAYYSMLRYAGYLPKYTADVIGLMRKRLLNIADAYLVHISSNAFGTVMGQSKKDFVWGSNAIAANQGILLVNAYLITGNQKYIYGSMTNLDYLLGKNATGYCFVTGCFGTKSPVHPHYKMSMGNSIDEPIPGLLVGGPNQNRQDKCNYPFTDAETSYTDNDNAYSCNGVATDWNAAMVYLVNAVEAMQYELKLSPQNTAIAVSH
ncbi:MAG: glycoside hydrolase family 9 protein [Chitinophagales bacterium]